MSAVCIISCLAFFMQVQLCSPEICSAVHCKYDFAVRWSRTMVYHTPDGRAAYNVVPEGDKLKIVSNQYHPASDPWVGQYVDPTDVHTADGYPRAIIEINGQFPGPTIQVMQGALVSKIIRYGTIHNICLGVAFWSYIATTYLQPPPPPPHSDTFRHPPHSHHPC